VQETEGGVQETEEGQCKRQDSCSARVRREAVLETGEWQCRKKGWALGTGSPEKCSVGNGWLS
jgi:hypothetical protein